MGIARNLGWLAVVVAGAVYASVNYAISDGPIPTLVSYASTGLLTFGGGLLAGTLAMRAWIGKPAEYSWESAEYVYEFDPHDVLKQQQTVKVTIRANKNKVERFRNRYIWSGTGENPPPRVLGGHTLVPEISRPGLSAWDLPWRYYYIVLDRPLNKGATADLEILQDLHDVDRTFRPTLAKTVTDPLGTLKLRVIFPPGIRPAEVRAVEWSWSKSSDGAWDISAEKAIRVDSVTGEAVYAIEKPRVGARYELIWNDEKYPR
ncbi:MULTISPECIES: hypothetical protein [Actinoplanes]|uniref:hypothetical protein n=1 Tax=Actinoplanes TaxID=1865 RepID=UPI0012F921EB|nr:MULTISPECIES: hypothetical protein [Actinoplanes]GLY04597.1 hypothetical protein Acsp01_49760 [Actinoplanes sp. NBRC 101535]